MRNVNDINYDYEKGRIIKIIDNTVNKEELYCYDCFYDIEDNNIIFYIQEGNRLFKYCKVDINSEIISYF